jgi:hypothetical protein
MCLPDTVDRSLKQYARMFRRRFPRVRLEPDKVMTEDSGLICSAGHRRDCPGGGHQPAPFQAAL